MRRHVPRGTRGRHGIDVVVINEVGLDATRWNGTCNVLQCQCRPTWLRHFHSQSCRDHGYGLSNVHGGLVNEDQGRGGRRNTIVSSAFLLLFLLKVFNRTLDIKSQQSDQEYQRQEKTRQDNLEGSLAVLDGYLTVPSNCFLRFIVLLHSSYLSFQGNLIQRRPLVLFHRDHDKLKYPYW